MGILRQWVTELTLQMQGTLLCAIRGPDGQQKESPGKPIVRALRACVMINAKDLLRSDKFIGDGSGLATEEDRERFFSDWDGSPFHWLTHLMHAAEIIGYYHPNDEVGLWWSEFYDRCCSKLHLNPETKLQLESRLAGNGTAVEVGFPCRCGSRLVVHHRCGNCLIDRSKEL